MFFLKYCRVDEKGCWIWQGKLSPQGYARVPAWWAGTQSGHVAIAKLTEIYEERMYVLHTYDTKACINPHHLYMGSFADNMQDRVVDGKQNTSHLTVADIHDIRAIPRVWGGRKEIAKKYGISVSTVKKIQLRYTWEYV